MNLFRELKENKFAEEQRLREERLRQLEEASKEKRGIQILHPAKALQDKKEMKQLRKEITAYEAKRVNTIKIVIAFCVLALIIVSLKVTSLKEKRMQELTPNTLQTSESNEVQKTEALNDVANTVVETSTPAIEPVLTPSVTFESDEDLPEEVPDTIQKTIETDELEIPKLTVDDIEITSIKTDYGHVETSTIVLGNEEGVTFTIVASALGLSADDIIPDYNKDLLSVKAENPFESGNKTYFKYYVTGKKTCNTQIVFITMYDYLSNDEVLGRSRNVRKLDSNEGRVCYVTKSRKYHFSGKCAGDNANITTFHDAIACEYEPCGKCAK